MGCQYGQIHNSLYKRRYNKKLNTLSKPLRKGRFCYAKNRTENRVKNGDGSKACAWLIYKGRFCYAKNRTENRVKNGDGSKACAWLIYKSAAKLTARLTPRRHPLAALAGAEAKRTPQRANKPKTETKERRRRGIAAEPLGDCRAHLSPRTAFFPSVLYRYCFPLQGTPRFCYVTFGNRAITSLSLDCPMYSPSIQHPKSSKSMNFLPSRP